MLKFWPFDLAFDEKCLQVVFLDLVFQEKAKQAYNVGNHCLIKGNIFIFKMRKLNYGGLLGLFFKSEINLVFWKINL